MNTIRIDKQGTNVKMIAHRGFPAWSGRIPALPLWQQATGKLIGVLRQTSTVLPTVSMSLSTMTPPPVSPVWK